MHIGYETLRTSVQKELHVQFILRSDEKMQIQFSFNQYSVQCAFVFVHFRKLDHRQSPSPTPVEFLRRNTTKRPIRPLNRLAAILEGKSTSSAILIVAVHRRISRVIICFTGTFWIQKECS